MLSNEYLLKGVAVPLAAGFTATLLAGRLSSGRRGTAAAGLAIAQALGTGLILQSQEAWFPSRNTEWIPWATVGAAALGPLVLASGLAAIERWLVPLFVTLLTAALIVPDWPDLWPSRPASIAAVCIGLAIVARGTERLGQRTPPRLAAIAVALSALVAAALIAASLSLKLGQSALTTAAAISGTAAALLIRPDAAALGGLALPYAVGVGGWCYVSAIELPPPAPPLVGLLFLPLAPLVLWLIAAGPLSRKSTRLRWTLGLTLVAAWLAAFAAWTWTTTEPGDDEYSLSSVDTSRL